MTKRVLLLIQQLTNPNTGYAFKSICADILFLFIIFGVLNIKFFSYVLPEPMVFHHYVF